MDFTPEDIDDLYKILTQSEMIWRERLTKGSKEHTEEECRAQMQKHHELQQKVFYMDHCDCVSSQK